MSFCERTKARQALASLYKCRKNSNVPSLLLLRPLEAATIIQFDYLAAAMHYLCISIPSAKGLFLMKDGSGMFEESNPCYWSALQCIKPVPLINGLGTPKSTGCYCDWLKRHRYFDGPNARPASHRLSDETTGDSIEESITKILAETCCRSRKQFDQQAPHLIKFLKTKRSNCVQKCVLHMH